MDQHGRKTKEVDLNGKETDRRRKKEIKLLS